MKYTFVNNPLYDKTNYIYSIYCAKEALKDDDIKLPQEDVVIETPKEDVLSMKDELQKQIVDHSEESDAGSISRAELNQKIIDMHNQGFSEVEIAKKLGVGLGEVKLVLGLFN